MSKQKKFSADAPEKLLENKERKHKRARGILTEREEILGSSQVPQGAYTQEYYDGTGNRVKFTGVMIKLYLDSAMLDSIFLDFIGGNNHANVMGLKLNGAGKMVNDAAVDIKADHPAIMSELLLRGGPITDNDKLHAMAGTKVGRAMLSQFIEPNDLFVGDASLKPMYVKDYYVLSAGISGTAAGLSKTVTAKNAVTANATFLERLRTAVAGV